ncbi:MAG: non-ribosomal peptide synthetase, partial [Acidobacteriota bacterium]
AYILDDAQVRVLLTQEHLGASLREDTNEVVCLDSDWELFSQESSEDPVKEVVAENLIAVIYTSGSTGKPKGTLLQAQGFLNVFDWFGTECLTADKPRILLMTPFSFDASFKVIVTPLLIGGVLVLASADAYDAGKLLKTIKKQAVSNTFITPSLLYSLLDFAKSTDYRDLSSLRAIFFGGEPTEVSKLRPWLNHKNCNCRLVHNYGPSECSDVTTAYRPNIEEINVLADLPIGAPINNVRVHVIDKNLNLQPIGVVGELCISGLSLSRGYLSKPELTAEKFMPNPFATGERFYRTGDRVKWLPTGQLQFLGRIDYQVKIRGIRIEPGEIEAVLNQHPAVLDSIVVAREIILGDKSLVGYVVTVKDQRIEVSDLRRYLKERLPEHMVPAALIIIDKLPLSPNGKVDRDVLPVPDDFRPVQVSDFVGPRNSVEEVLAGIWSGVLNLERVGIHDNFFELGGHSLLATQVVSRIQNALQVELPVRRIFEYPTVAELSEWMLQESGKRSDMEARASILLKIARLTDEEAEGWLQEKSALKN